MNATIINVKVPIKLQRYLHLDVAVYVNSSYSYWKLKSIKFQSVPYGGLQVEVIVHWTIGPYFRVTNVHLTVNKFVFDVFFYYKKNNKTIVTLTGEDSRVIKSPITV